MKTKSQISAEINKLLEENGYVLVGKKTFSDDWDQDGTIHCYVTDVADQHKMFVEHNESERITHTNI